MGDVGDASGHVGSGRLCLGPSVQETAGRTRSLVLFHSH